MAAPTRDTSSFPEAPLRRPSEVMRLARMGAAFPTRLSFMRSLLRRLNAEAVRVERPVWEIGAEGYGRAVYTLAIGGAPVSLVAFSTPLAPELRTDRVIAEAWDASFVLFDGRPDEADLERLEANAPRQEAGRFAASDLVLSRANKSVRMFEHVVSRLAEGRQPDPGLIRNVGYLMRTTAVYGNGKFGIADRARIADRPALSGPFRAEMLAVWLIREFTHDLAEHVARARNPDGACGLAPRLRRHLGIGNATGLGMAPFLVSHPLLINNWMMARETALARVRALPAATAAEVARVQALFARAIAHVHEWSVEDARQMARIDLLRQELPQLAALLSPALASEPQPWDRLVCATAGLSLETQELVAALVIEPQGDLVDGLAECMESPAEPRIEPAMRVRRLRAILADSFAWALGMDFGPPASRRRFWYVSEEKLEPRLGDRFEEPGAELEMPLDVARQVQALARDLEGVPEDRSVAEFLLAHPGHRNAVKRAQIAARYLYSEIRDNLIGEDCLPIDMLRCKLAFFGAAKFDPKSDRWTRITMYQGAPTRHDIADADADDWWLPWLGDAP